MELQRLQGLLLRVVLVVLISSHSDTSLIGVTPNATLTNSSWALNTTQEPPKVCPPDYTQCKCVFGPEHHKYYYDWHSLSHQRSWLRDLIAATYGLPFGLLLSLATFYLYHYCKSDDSLNRKPQAKWNWRTNIKGRVSPMELLDSKTK